MEAPFDRIESTAQVITGMKLLDDGSLHILDLSRWNTLRAGIDPRP
jgi:hypothetical protein